MILLSDKEKTGGSFTHLHTRAQNAVLDGVLLSNPAPGTAQGAWHSIMYISIQKLKPPFPAALYV